jgi:elongation factor Ts
MPISASEITKLRESTGAGMMDCKIALDEAGGDMEKAAEILRKKGVVKAAKRADKVAAEGIMAGYVKEGAKVGAVVEVNSETDFVAKSDEFISFANEVAKVVVENNPADMQALMASSLASGKTLESTLSDMTLKIGEKLSVRRFVRYEGEMVAMYLHGKKIGVLVEMQGGDSVLGVDVAMHIAASNPKAVSRDQVSADLISKEKEIYAEQLKKQGKPENIIENILKGKMDKFYGEVCLLEQPFIKNEEIKVEKLLLDKNAKVIRFARLELGEGIEKQKKDFASEVAEQMK